MIGNIMCQSLKIIKGTLGENLIIQKRKILRIRSNNWLKSIEAEIIVYLQQG